jgi:hypothetical protein
VTQNLEGSPDRTAAGHLPGKRVVVVVQGALDQLVLQHCRQPAVVQGSGYADAARLRPGVVVDPARMES